MATRISSISQLSLLSKQFGHAPSGSFSYTIANITVSADNELAFCHSFNHVKGRLANGDEIDMRWRATICFGKVNGEWLIMYEHSPVPFEPESGKALIKQDT